MYLSPTVIKDGKSNNPDFVFPYLFLPGIAFFGSVTGFPYSFLG